MKKNDFELKITPKETKDYRHRSFVFPNTLWNDLETRRTNLSTPISMNLFVRKILELYIERSKEV